MVAPRLRNTVPLFCLVAALASALCAAPARAQVQLSALRLDRRVCRPSPVITVTATLTQPVWHGHWYVQSGTITIDGTAHEAIITNNATPRTTLSYAWAAPGGRAHAGSPSTHTVSASARIQYEYEGPPSGPIRAISSTAPPPAARGCRTGFYGDGRAAGFVLSGPRRGLTAPRRSGHRSRRRG